MSDGANGWKQFYDVATLSDVGMRRATNQDNLAVSMASNFDYWKKHGHLLLVADGMGAHAAGELASKLAADNIPHLYNKYNDLSAPEALKRAVIDANAEINRRGQANEDFYNMGTTCSVMTLLPQGAVLAHVGDSRIYRLQKNKLEQLTYDHSLVWEMRATGQFGEDTAANVVPKNVITRSLGPYPDVKVDMEGPFPVEVGDVFLLCSDGLTGQVSDEEIGGILANLSPKEAARVLVDLSNLRGGPDNITVVVAKVLHPEVATTLSGSNPITIGSNPNRGKINPLFWALLIASIVGTFVCLFVTGVYSALVPGAIALLCLAWLVFQMSGLASGGTAVTAGKRFGKGPYVRVNCDSTEEFNRKLKVLVDELCDELSVAIDGDDKKINEFYEKANKASESGDHRTATAEFSRLISHLMQRIRDSHNRKSSESHIDL